jgi:hypothetical protein
MVTAPTVLRLAEALVWLREAAIGINKIDWGDAEKKSDQSFPQEWCGVGFCA